MNPHFASLLLALQDAAPAAGANALQSLAHPNLGAFVSTSPDAYRVLGWIVLMPLIGAIINGVFGRYLSRDAVYIAGVGSVATSFVLALFAFTTLVRAHAAVPHAEGGEEAEVIARLSYDAGQWFHAPLGPTVTQLLHFRYVLDALSGVMLLVVTGVGLLIHVYSTGYMSHDKGYAKFFAFLNLFMFSMLNLILADNIPLLFVGWEGVGLCSYLLIGFWYTNSQYASAGRKAFIVNRIGDVGVILGMTILAWKVGAYSFSDIHAAISPPGGGTSVAMTALSTPTELNDFVSSFFAAPNFMALHDAVYRAIPTFTWGGLACVLLFIGCTGKSAQLPLYVWLPDAMAGPTPVSALIHAATMVTAGVYLLCRLSFMYVHFPNVMAIVALVGGATALFAATVAVAQVELKKVLAYSTVSQLGFMFLGCGVGAFSAGLFHVYTHAMFKACLFLCAGAVMHACRDKQDIRELGGLRKYMPWTFRAFSGATLAIIGTPLFSGFFSKDEILFRALASPHALDARICALLPLVVIGFVLFAAIGKGWSLAPIWLSLGFAGGLVGALGGIIGPSTGGKVVGVIGMILLGLAALGFVANVVMGFVKLGLWRTIGGLGAIVVAIVLAKLFVGVSVGKLAFALGVIAATLTAFYMCRLWFLTFWGDFKGWSLVPGTVTAGAGAGGGEHEPANAGGDVAVAHTAHDAHGHDDHAAHDAHDAHGHDDHGHGHGNPWDAPKDNPWNMTGVLVVLGVLSVVAGYIGLPYAWTHSEGLLGRWLEGPVVDWHIDHHAMLGTEMIAMVFGIGAFVVGSAIAYWMYIVAKGEPARSLAASVRPLYLLVVDKWRIDELYGLAVVAVVQGFSDYAAMFDRYFVDGLVNGVAWIPRLISMPLRTIQTGRVQTYGALVAAGTAAILGWSMYRPAATIAYRVDGNRVTLQAYGGPGYSYQWDLEGDGTFADPTDQTQASTTCTPSEAPDGRRVCHVGLRVRNAFGRTADVTRTVVLSGGEELR